MNRIYKVIRKTFSGEAVVVSELAGSRGKSLCSRSGVLFKTGTTLLLAACTTGAMAQQVYDDSSASMLETAAIVVNGGLPGWVGINSTDEGLVYKNSGSTVVTGADLVIDYTTAPVPKFVIGGFADDGTEVKQNTVTFKQGSVDGPVYAGLSHQTVIKPDVDKSGDPSPLSNIATITANFPASTPPTAQANQNTVNVNDGVVFNGDIYGGNATIWTQAGNATAGNTSTNDGSYNAYAFTHAYTYLANMTVSGNAIAVGDGASVTGDIHGGMAMLGAQTGSATGGTITVTNANALTYGEAQAYVDNSTVTASSNRVVVGNGSSVTGNTVGGFAIAFAQAGNAAAGGATATGTGNVTSTAYSDARITESTVTANDNAVTIGENASVTGNILGGYSTVSLVTNDARGGNANTAGSLYASGAATADVDLNSLTITASDNKVTVGNGSTVSGDIRGGFTNVTENAGSAIAGNASTAAGAAANPSATALARVNASEVTVTANDNRVTVGDSSTVGGDIHGGYANLELKAGTAIAGNADGAGSANAYANAQASAFANDSIITASDNKVTVGNGSTVGGNLHGGFAGLTIAAGTATGGKANGATQSASAIVDIESTQVLANKNEVTMNGILSGGSIYGGYVTFDITKGTATGNATSDDSVTLTGTLAQAINNTVTIRDNAQINSPSGSLYGGYLSYNPGFAPASYDVFTGNTLNYSAKTTATFQTVGNFQNYNFTINPVHANTGISLITAQDIALGANGTNVSTGANTPSKITVLGIHSGNFLNAGDKFVLMEATNSMTGAGTADQYSTVTQAQQGISWLYNVETTVDTAGKMVTARIVGCDAGKCATVNPQLKSLSEGYLAGSQLVLRGADMIADDAFMAINTQNNKKGYAPFAILSGQHNRYNSGSHITSNDFLLTGGMSYQYDRLTAGAFLEAGWASYDTFNNFSNATSVDGDGHDRYYGVGLLGRYDFTTGFYADASLRYGRNSNKFTTDDIQNFATGESARYKLKSNYLSAHLGGGYVVPVDERNQLDLSAKYLWTRLGGKNANIAGDKIHFDNIQSHRARLFAMLNHQYTNNMTMHAGIGYEHEFDGKARAAVSEDCDIDAPYIKGGTGIFSVGATIRPEFNRNLTLNLKGNGYVGKREGVSASIKLNYAF